MWIPVVYVKQNFSQIAIVKSVTVHGVRCQCPKGDLIIFCDCDNTSDFSNLAPIYRPLAENKFDFMTRGRSAGQMEDGAMSFSHRLGVPFLSWCGRVKFGVKIHDWHCGIRGIRRDALQKLNLKTDGMESATEMIAEAS